MRLVNYIKLSACLLMMVLIIQSCQKSALRNPSRDPVSVFEQLCKVINERYAMLEYKKVNWNSIHDAYRQKASSTTTDQQLFDILSGMLDSLRDGHVALSASDRVYTYNGYYLPYDHNFNYELLMANYLTKPQKIGVVTVNEFDDVLYVYIPTFKQTLTPVDLEQVLNKMHRFKKIIIDVRDNSGGESALVDQLVRLFLTKRQLLKYDVYKKASAGNEYYAPVAKYLDPVSDPVQFTSVCVLTNRRCFSSCNDFVLYMSALPNVHVIGDYTGGGGGTPFNYELSNGWRLTYSASMALTPNGDNIEDGLKPDTIITNTLADDAAGRDAILEYGIKRLK